MNELLESLFNAILNGDSDQAKNAVQAALDGSLNPANILSDGMIPAMREVGKRFEDGDYYVPEMLVSARAMQAGLNILKPLMAGSGVRSAGKVAIGTIKGDLHEIGKNLVAIMLEGAGFEIIDLGVDVPPEAFVEAVRAGAQIIGMSALLTTTMSSMGVTIAALKDAGLRDQVKVM